MWIGLSGASRNLIEKTGIFQERELIKYARYGRIITIPAVLGAIAAGYAASTFNDNHYIYIGAAILWFFIVLWVDMFLSSTLYKSKRADGSGFFVAVVFRLLLSFVVGVTISHPLILFIFNDSIVQYVKDIDQDKKTAKITNVSGQINDTENPIQKEINLLQQEVECKSLLISNEQSFGDSIPRSVTNPTNGKYCGTVSGKGSVCGDRCNQYKEEKKILEDRIKKLDEQKTGLSSGLKAVLNQHTESLTDPAVKDYLARTEALEMLGENHSHIGWATTFLMLTFVLLDCLIVLGKATTPMGAYEHVSDVLLDELIAGLEAEKEAHVLYAKTVSQGKVKMEAQNELDMLEMLAITNLVANTHDKLQANKEKFRKLKQAELKNISFFNLSKRKKIKIQIHEMEHLYDLAYIKTMGNLKQKINSM